MRVICVVGARPNFIKIAPLLQEMKNYPEMIKPILVHTGQHYNKQMSDEIFRDLSLPEPDIYLGIGSDSHARQTARIMMGFEKIVEFEMPDLVLVVGDVNSTLACALVAAKRGISVAHVEAGLRSFNREMPEEINRIITDRLSDFLFTTEEDAIRNLIKEGIPKSRIFFTGNVMIDALKKYYKRGQKNCLLQKLNLSKKDFALLTMHRPENVDEKNNLNLLIEIIKVIQNKMTVVFPVHPRTQVRFERFGLKRKVADMKNLILTEPFGYLDFLSLEGNAKVVLTDSGGIQEETTILGVPCLTLRNETERPVTVKQGTNIITGLNKDKVIKEFNKIVSGRIKVTKIPKYWDGQAAKRIIKVLIQRRSKIVRLI